MTQKLEMESVASNLIQVMKEEETLFAQLAKLNQQIAETIDVKDGLIAKMETALKTFEKRKAFVYQDKVFTLHEGGWKPLLVIIEKL